MMEALVSLQCASLLQGSFPISFYLVQIHCNDLWKESQPPHPGCCIDMGQQVVALSLS